MDRARDRAARVGDLFDEPTSHLDLGASVETLRLVLGLAAGGALVVAVAAPARRSGGFADRVVVLGNGGMIADGPPSTRSPRSRSSAPTASCVTVEHRPDGGVPPQRTARSAQELHQHLRRDALHAVVQAEP